MHILMIGTGNNPAIFIQRQIKELQDLGIEISLFPDFTSHKYINNLLCRKGFVFNIPKNILDIVKLADIIHYQWPGHLINFSILAKRYAKPSILSLRGKQINVKPYLPGNNKYLKQLRLVLSNCDAVHCVSNAMLQEFKNVGLNHKNFWIIRPAVDTEYFTIPTVKPNLSTLNIVMVGALIWRKGYEYALLASKILSDCNIKIHLTIIGEGNERDRLEYTISDLGLKDKVNLTGYLNSKQIKEHLQRNQVFLHTSLSEGIPNAVLEGMACGLPIVAFNAGGISEVITNGKEGFVVPVRDEFKIVEALQQLSSNNGLINEMGLFARQRVVNEFNASDQASNFREMYQSLLRQ